MQNKGFLVTLEAPEGGGKTELAKRLKNYYEDLGVEVIVSREPGGIDVAEKIRKIVINNEMHPVTEAYLYLAARAEHVQKVIKPVLEAGKLVILDRFMFSTLAIQGGGRGLDIPELIYHHKLALDGLEPGINLFLDVDPEVGLKRKLSQGEINKFEKEDIEFHKRVYNTYQTFVKDGYLKRIDASMSPEQVFLEATKVIDKHLNI